MDCFSSNLRSRAEREGDAGFFSGGRSCAASGAAVLATATAHCLRVIPFWFATTPL